MKPTVKYTIKKVKATGLLYPTDGFLVVNNFTLGRFFKHLKKAENYIKRKEDKFKIKCEIFIED